MEILGIEDQKQLCRCGNSGILFALHHVDHFPGTILRAEFAPDTNLFVNDNDTVDVVVIMFVGILRAGYFVETIDRTKFDANFAARTSFRMYNRYQRRLFLLLRRRDPW